MSKNLLRFPSRWTTGLAGLILAAFLQLSPPMSSQTNDHEWTVLGKLETLPSREITDSRWSVGGETLDRDYADFHAYREYLGRSGAKRVRLQGGWAKCEPVKGEYNFEWLDAIIDGALEEGVQPWVQLSYGNPIYEGGGEPVLAGGIPTGEEALEAWDNWVEATVTRYKDRVSEWEIWNEPDLAGNVDPADFARFHARTSAVIKRVQPESRIIGLSIAYIDRHDYITALLDLLREEDRLDEFDVLAHHGYTSRPERAYPYILQLRELLDSYRPGIALWQGENGAPSTPRGTTIGALSREDWSETTQAKWNLRRMLGDIGHDIEVVNIFTLSDLHYHKEDDHMTGHNTKGLLVARPDGSIERPKAAFGAYQRVATLFRGELERLREMCVQNAPVDFTAFAFSRADTPGAAVALWFTDDRPRDEFAERLVDLTVAGLPPITDPVVVDLLTGEVRSAPPAMLTAGEDGIRLKRFPVGDYPLIIADRSWVTLLSGD
ncbi:MAG: beta-galactosidase [Opitutales bacterium]|nr:beta-galactosidase [Opitutales bacterium]